jgi:hypothetical protein
MVRRPTPEVLVAAEAVARRNKGRPAQLRRSFIEREDVQQPTPLARMIRGGRGGTVRLKLYLSILWLAAAPPHDVAYPARAWATLLGLPDPGGRGARRINDAISWLEEQRFLTVEAVPGHPNRLTLLEESGTGRRYRVPGAAYSKGKKREIKPEVLERHRYVKIPPEFWTSGWLATLSASGVAMLLVLLAEKSGRSYYSDDVWLSPDVARMRYVLSEDTRGAGLDELRRAQIVTVKRRSVGGDVFDRRRFRNVYDLHIDRLAEAAEVPDKDGSLNNPFSEVNIKSR